MAHPTTIRHAIWDTLRRFYRDFRRIVAESEEHSGEALVVPVNVAEVRAALGRQYFAPNWQFSYHERGEQLNLARVEYDVREVRDHEFVWWQTHVRGWVQGDGSVRLRPHYELEPTEYDQDHLSGIGLEVPLGVEKVARALDAEGIPYEHYENLPAGGEE